MTITSNPVTVTVAAGSQISYSVSMTASPSSNISTTDDVTFTIYVTASNGSSVSGSATMYLANSSGTVWGQWPVTINNGSGSTTLQPGLYLQAGTDTMYYYATYNGYQSPQYELTFQTSIPPTSITLTASTTQDQPGGQVTFTITTNGSNVSLTLYAYNSSSNASNAPSLTGQLAQYPISIGTSGSYSTTLIPTQLASDTYWVAVYDNNVLSNIVEVQEVVVQPTSISLSASGNASVMTFTVTSQAGTSFSCSLYVYNSYNNASNAPSLTGQWGAWVNWISVVNGTGSVMLSPAGINTNTQYWIAVYQLPDGTILRSNIVTVVG
ncbi:MAG: hypothetical protein QXV17_10380 [Candidatus Micrarchaeaceae archaeon]